MAPAAAAAWQTARPRPPARPPVPRRPCRARPGGRAAGRVRALDGAPAPAPPPPPLHPGLDRDIFALLLPAAASVFLEPAMQVVDTACVGRLGTVSLGALGLSNLVYFFSTVVFSFLLVATVPAVAAAEAAGDRAGSSGAISKALWTAGGLGVALAAALWLGAPAALAALAPGADVAAAAVPHLRLRALGAPATLALLVTNGAFRGHRDTATPLLAGAAQNGVHLFLDALLLLRPGATLPCSALAATAGAYVGAGAMAAALGGRGLLRRAELRARPTRADVLSLLAPGAPLAACVAAVAGVVLTAANAAAGLGPASLAAHTIVKQVVDFALAAFGAFSVAAQALVATALGARDPARARAAVWRLLALGAGVGAAAAAGLAVGGRSLPSFFTADPAVAAAAAAVLPVVALLMPLAPCGAALEGALLGSMRVAWVGGRTLAGCALAVALLARARGSSAGLLAVWAASSSLLFFNAAADAWMLASRRSPLRGGAAVGAAKAG